MANLVEWNNHLETKHWDNEHEASKAVEIVRLLGYEGDIIVNLDGLILDVGGVNVPLPAGYCEKLLPSNIKSRIERYLTDRKKRIELEEHNERSFRRLRNERA